MLSLKSRRHKANAGIHIVDETKSIYHIYEPRQWSHRVKLRPFCAEFLIAAMQDFEVHWNTAATRAYGLRIIQVLKSEVLAKKGTD
jgi:hypothetical protein